MRSIRTAALVAPLLACTLPVDRAHQPAATEGPASAMEWRTYAPLPTGRSHMAKAVADGKVYVMGGLGPGVTPLAVVERYDPSEDRWERLADLPLALDHPMAAAVGSDVFVIGGLFGTGSDRGFRYDSRANRWVEIARLPQPRSAGGAAVVDGIVYLVGGVGPGTGPDGSGSLYAYDRTLDRWRDLALMPTPRQHLAVAEFRERVCVMGGRGAATKTFECYDPRTDEWERMPDMPFPGEDFDAVTVGQELWAITRGRAQTFDGTRWRLSPPLPTPSYGFVVAAVGSRIFVVGGAEFGTAVYGVDLR